MTWITDALEQQQRDAEQAAIRMDNVLGLKEKFNQQMPAAWGRIADAIQRDIEQLNAAGGRWVFDPGTKMVQIHAENEIAALFTLEIDPTNGTLRYNCPVPPGRPGVPLIGTFQIQAGTSEARIIGNSRGRVVEFKPEQVSQFLFSATILPNHPPRF